MAWAGETYGEGGAGVKRGMHSAKPKRSLAMPRCQLWWECRCDDLLVKRACQIVTCTIRVKEIWCIEVIFLEALLPRSQFLG